MRVLFDTNVLLDALLARPPFVTDARILLSAVEAGQFEGFISATTITDIHYVVRRQTQSQQIAITAITRLLELMAICTVDRTVLAQALALNLKDFEDAVQVACAIVSGLDAIVTRDLEGFVGVTVTIISPSDLSRRFS